MAAEVTHNQKYFIFISLQNVTLHYARSLCAVGKVNSMKIFSDSKFIGLTFNRRYGRFLRQSTSTNDVRCCYEREKTIWWGIDFKVSICVCVCLFFHPVGCFSCISTRQASGSWKIFLDDEFLFIDVILQKKKKKNKKMKKNTKKKNSDENGIRVNPKRHARRFLLIMTDETIVFQFQFLFVKYRNAKTSSNDFMWV